MAVSATVVAEVPDPNPQPQPDGTNIWYVGNDTQYPVIQDVLDACSDGDEIVISEGLYVESLQIIRNDITLRPFCMDPLPAAPPLPAGIGHWADVVIWNPTEGFNNANGYAIQITGGNNTYIGEPRQITELDNGYMVETLVQPGEWNPAPVIARQPSLITREQLQDPRLARKAMTFWSRSIDNVAVYSTNGTGTFQSCLFTSDSGYGGGATIVGEANRTEFVKCEFSETFATGEPLRLADGSLGPPVTVITIEDGMAMFLDCDIRNNFSGGPDGIVFDTNGRVHWDDCRFVGNNAVTSAGTYVCKGGTPTFTRTRFEDCLSWMGTIHWDSTGLVGPEMMRFIQCNFIRCNASDLMRGAVAWVVCDDCEGAPPLILLSDCGFRQNQQMLSPPGGWTPFDVWTPYFPKFRIGNDLRLNGLVPGVSVDNDGIPGDLNGDGLVDTVDLDELLTILGSCTYDGDFNGVVDINDLLGLIASYGVMCQ
ncbi:MAG: hypothetical protein MK116_13390 [Phycisphaerales bacterium]|nr:hypothetical protein [Phycisphaerales bacterium]